MHMNRAFTRARGLRAQFFEPTRQHEVFGLDTSVRSFLLLESNCHKCLICPKKPKKQNNNNYFKLKNKIKKNDKKTKIVKFLKCMNLLRVNLGEMIMK